MPYKNRSVKSFENCYYHVYARGVNRCLIYKRLEDKKFFLYLLKKYLTKNFIEIKESNGLKYSYPVNTSFDSILLQAFSLMPNHFHLLIKVKSNGGLAVFMQKILSNYTRYFNNKYNRSGQLFGGSYRSVKIEDENQLNIVGVYIHLNQALKNIKVTKYNNSFDLYYHNKKLPWITPNKTLIKNLNFSNLASHNILLNISKKDGISLGIVFS